MYLGISYRENPVGLAPWAELHFLVAGQPTALWLLGQMGLLLSNRLASESRKHMDRAERKAGIMIAGTSNGRESRWFWKFVSITNVIPDLLGATDLDGTSLCSEKGL